MLVWPTKQGHQIDTLFYKSLVDPFLNANNNHLAKCCPRGSIKMYLHRQ